MAMLVPGELCALLPSQPPGLLNFHTAARRVPVAHAHSPELQQAAAVPQVANPPTLQKWFDQFSLRTLQALESLPSKL